MSNYIPKDIENISNNIRAILEREGFKDSLLQLDQGQLWGLIKDDFPKEGLQLHVRAFYTDGKLQFRTETEPIRFTFEHTEERYRSYGEGARIFMEIMKKNGVDIQYEGNVLDLYVMPQRPASLTSWVPLAIAGFIILFFVVIDSLRKPTEE